MPRLERMRREEKGTEGGKSYAEFKKLWRQTFGAKFVNDLVDEE